ncbi:TIGR03621 family F420-dependent LLM class oxidoreductase [Amycolatopsis pigmentata]|uniref:TIGR03621 family F420-dependent LLM class oxidoreductase n=1 Tax=Amycolatopsis pigmentata TaxID=450801 RepID=A0ABW5FZA5_9PSEU
MMTARDFRFGVNLFTAGPRKAWQETARRVEDLGYDVLLVPDHLGMTAPFPALVSAAEVTTRPRLGTLVLNAGFYRPALLARDVAGVHELTDGRFELGVGTGYAAAEFEAAGLPFPGARQRIEHLEHTVTEVSRELAAAGHRVPMMIGGAGEKVLTIAARHADIVNIAGAGPLPGSGQADPLSARVGFVRRAAGERFDQLELGMFLAAVHIAGSGEPDLFVPRALYPDLSEEELLALPGVLHGSAGEVADSLRGIRETYGISYFATADRYLAPLAKVISQLR